MDKGTKEEGKRRDNVSQFRGARFIMESSVKLKLNSVTEASACVLFHRFYQECKLSDYDAYTIAATAIFLATKVEEQHTRLRDVVNVCYKTLHPDKRPLEIGRQLYDFKDTISNCELLLLRTLKFRVTCDHPHKYLLHYLMSLSHLFNSKEWERLSIAQTSWAILRDSYHGSICLNYRPQLVAISCIYLALMSCKVDVPLSADSKTPWWKVCHGSASKEEIKEVMDKLVDLYSFEESC